MFLLALVLTIVNAAGDSQNSKPEANEPAILEIHLRDMGYQPTQEYRYPGTGVPRDLSILNDDYNKRLAFIDDKNLVVYQSHCPPEKDGSPGLRSMEAFFVNPQTGTLNSRKTWPTNKPRE